MDEHYIAKSTVAALGLTHLFIHGQIQEEADFTISGDSIKPNHYGSADTLAGNDSTIAMDFDYVNSRALGTRDGDPFELPINATAFDRLSLQYVLMLALTRDEKPDTFV